MAIFNKQICTHCGKAANILTRRKLKDGQYICSECSKKCPSFFITYCLDRLTYSQYVEYLQHREENRKKLEEFNVTDVYFDRVYVDMDKGWMIFGQYGDKFRNKAEMLSKNPDIFDVSKMIYANLLYIPKDVKEGFFNDKACMDVKLVIAFDDPWYPVSFAETVMYDYRAKIEGKKMFSSDLIIELNPIHNELVTYLGSVLLENGVDIPISLGNAVTTKFDLTPYDTYLKTLFRLINMLVYSSKEEDLLLEKITPSSVLRHRIKSIYGKQK